MVSKAVTLSACDADPAIRITNIPALVCGRCDIEVFSEDVSRRLDQIRSSRAVPHRTEVLYVFDYSQPFALTMTPVGHRVPSIGSFQIIGSVDWARYATALRGDLTSPVDTRDETEFGEVAVRFG